MTLNLRSLTPVTGLILFSCCVALAQGTAHAEENTPIRVLIVDGRNNHAWESTTHALRQILLQTGRFRVDVSTAPSPYPKSRPRRPSKATAEETRRYEAAMADYHAAAKKYEASIAESGRHGGRNSATMMLWSTTTTVRNGYCL